MERALLSVGLDIGTSTTQMVLSRLTVENKASAFAVPDLAITDREIIYRSAIHFTPLQSDTVIDAEAIQAIVDEEYRKAGIEKSAIETGAVIITGELADVTTALTEIVDYFRDTLGYVVCKITKR